MYLVVLVHVDDIILTRNCCTSIEKLIYKLNMFPLKDLRHLNYFLGIEVVLHRDMLHHNQQKYIHDLLCKYGLLDSKDCDTLMATRKGLSQADSTMLKATDASFTRA